MKSFPKRAIIFSAVAVLAGAFAAKAYTVTKHGPVASAAQIQAAVTNAPSPADQAAHRETATGEGQAEGAQGCKTPRERGDAQAVRILPLVAAQMPLTAAEQDEIRKIMGERSDKMDALPRADRDDKSAAGVQALDAQRQQGSAIDKAARARLVTLLGEERGRKLYSLYFRLDSRAQGREGTPVGTAPLPH